MNRLEHAEHAPVESWQWARVAVCSDGGAPAFGVVHGVNR